MSGLLPDWVPDDAINYLVHTETGQSIRALARDLGCHASTVLRQVRRIEGRRDDLLVDDALRRLTEAHVARFHPDRLPEEKSAMSIHAVKRTMPPDDDTIEREARRVLRRMAEPGACLAIARDMEKAVVVRDTGDGRTVRTAIVERPVAEAMALKDWIATEGEARITRYRITQAGRAALRRLVVEEEAARGGTGDAFAFADQHRDYDEREVGEAGSSEKRRLRYNLGESPLTTLARRRDKTGEPFLGPDLVAAGERLREDFELAQMGPRVTQNWDKFLTGGDRGAFNASDGRLNGPAAARDRVMRALSDLGPGLGDVVLRCCCFLEGMEAAEQRMGWSARSGKIVLRIALQRLRRHYDENAGSWSPMIG